MKVVFGVGEQQWELLHYTDMTVTLSQRDGPASSLRGVGPTGRLQLESAVGLNSHSKTRAGRPVFGPAYSPARPLALPMPLLSSGPIAIGVVATIRDVLLGTLR